MPDLHTWGISTILWLQSLYPPLDGFVKAANTLGTEEFFLVALPVIWWCFDKRIGSSLAFLFLYSDYLARVLKGITNVTRPYDVTPSIRVLDPQPDSSFPSAGALDTTVFAVCLAVAARKKAFWIMALTAVVLIAFTRVYLGAHYPTDVLASIVLGAVILFVAIRGRAADRIRQCSPAIQWVLAIVPPLVLALIKLNGETAVILGAVLGFGVGMLLEARYVGFDTKASVQRQVVKVLVGLGIGIGLRLLLKPMLPAADEFTFIRYSVLGLWMALGAPWLFVALRLTRTVKTAPGPTENAQAFP
jgi:membrane-associated phospholipid phosphatase